MARVFVGMSGGVDSSAAALLLRRQGHSVRVIHLRLLEGSPCRRRYLRRRRTPGPWRRLGVPIHFLDLSKEFRERGGTSSRSIRRAGPPTLRGLQPADPSSAPCWTPALALGASILPPGTTPQIRAARPPAAGFLLRGMTRPGTKLALYHA